MPGRRRLAWGLLAIAAGGAAPASSAEDVPAPSAQAQSTPFVVQTRLEPVRLPGGERMGLWTQSWMLAHEGWWLGPSVAAAATGQRGGLFVLGAQVARRWAWTDEGPGVAADQARNWLETSLYVGGGGGAAAPVGGGLMLAPALAWMHDWGGWQTGLSWSRVKFPSGRIGSSQVGLVLQWDGRWRWWDVGDVGRSASGSDGALWQPEVLGWHRGLVQGAVLKPRGGARIGLIGALAERDASQGAGPDEVSGSAWAWTLETAAATHGGADGYMEMLGGGAWRLRLADGPGAVPTVALRGALGLGGGGAVPTGGGLIGKMAVQARWPVGWGLPAGPWAPGAFVQWELGGVAGPGSAATGRYRAAYAQAALGWDLNAAVTGRSLGVRGWRASATWQRQTHAARKVGAAAPLDTVGLKLSADDAGPCGLQAQAHSAYAGGAGAYSLGLVGVGCATAPGPWRLGAEALVGAAGGGGVATRGGAVVGGQLWLQGAVSPSSAWQIGLGRLRSLKVGGAEGPALDTPVVDLSWTLRFGQVGPGH